MPVQRASVNQKSGVIKKKTINKPPVIKLFVIELLLSNLIGLILLSINTEIAYSAMLGGLIAAAANLAFALPAYRYEGAAAIHKMVRNFYQGEIAKVIVAALLFAAVFKWVSPVNLVALFVTFAILLTLHGAMPALLTRFLK